MDSKSLGIAPFLRIKQQLFGRFPPASGSRFPFYLFFGIKNLKKVCHFNQGSLNNNTKLLKVK